MRGYGLLRLLALVAALTLGGNLAGCQVDATEEHSLEKAAVVRVVDGDTLAVLLDGEEQKVRLVNVNAPESVSPDEEKNTAEGVEASDFVKGLLAPGDGVWLQKEVSDTDRYGRLLRHVWLAEPSDAHDPGEVGEKMLDAILVRNGYAEVVDYPPDTAYSRLFRSFSESRWAPGAGHSERPA